MDDRVGPDVADQPLDRLSISHVELVVHEVLERCFESALHPAGISVGSEKNSSLIVVYPVNAMTEAREVGADLRSDQAGGPRDKERLGRQIQEIICDLGSASKNRLSLPKTRSASS